MYLQLLRLRADWAYTGKKDATPALDRLTVYWRGEFSHTVYVLGAFQLCLLWGRTEGEHSPPGSPGEVWGSQAPKPGVTA